MLILLSRLRYPTSSVVVIAASSWPLTVTTTCSGTTVTTTCSGTINLFINIILLSRRSPRSLGDIRYESVPTLTIDPAREGIVINWIILRSNW